jgi:MFS family permease
LGTILMPFAAHDWHIMAALLFVWGGAVAALYTVGLAHLGTQLSGHDLANANAAFILCYGVGMVLGPQAIGISMDIFGVQGFGWALGAFFAAYIGLAVARIAFRGSRT